MKPELRKLIIERYTGWVEAWGLSLAFAVTQSLEKAERVVADAIVALIATEQEQEDEFGPELTSKKSAAKGPQLPSSVNPIRFAMSLWELSNAQAYRGFGADPFFRMPAVARAIVILKTKAQFSRNQIAAALGLKTSQVDDHLENARLLHSDGRPWLAASPGVQVSTDDEARWTPECPQWAGTMPRSESETPNLQDTFAQYVGNDLDSEAGRKLHSHLVVCGTCRTSFAFFKKQYNDWTSSLPTIEADKDLRKHLAKVTRTALRLRRKGPPRFLPGVRRVMREGQVQAFFLGAASLMILHMILTRKPNP